MRMLHRKLLRDIRGQLGPLVVVLMIITVGAGSFIGMGGVQRILKSSQLNYYRAYRFADFWIDVKKAPLSAVEQLARLPGVGAVAGRVVFDVILDVPNVEQPIRGRLISAPARGVDRTLNGICIVRGSGFSDDRDEEVILGDAFAREHDLRPGDRIGLLLNRRRQSFVVVGTALSPEYVYMVSGQGDFVPDARHFGILYIREDYARDVLDFSGSCNQIVGRFTVDAPDRRELLLDRMGRLLDPYGVLELTPRQRQASHRFLSDEIHGLQINSKVLPGIFLTVAALVLNVMMRRLAERQRTIIGTLKALGYSRRAVLKHFLAFGVLVGVAGGIGGVGFGALASYGMMQMYTNFFEFPVFLYQVYPDLIALGVLISVFFAVLGSARGAGAVLWLEPAEAMRPKPPARGGAIRLERWAFVWQRLDFRTRMALRSVFRNPGRTISGVIASALATALVLATFMLLDSVHFLVEFQFERVAHSDVDIGMRAERSYAALYEGRRLPGVDQAEAVLAVACDLRYGRQTRRIAITGLSQPHTLTTPRTQYLAPIDIPAHGLVLSEKLARILGVKVGDRLELTPARGRKRTVSAPVASIVDAFLGLACYADRGYLGGLVGEANAMNVVQIATNGGGVDELYRTIKKLPNAQGLSVRANAIGNIEKTFVETMGASFTILILLAGLISFGSILNTTRIEIAERQRDIATLRTLGYRAAQVAGIFFRQNLVVFAFGLMLGLPLGFGLFVGIITMFDTELFRAPLVVRVQTIALTAVIALAFVLLAQALVYRLILKQDWRADIQVRE